MTNGAEAAAEVEEEAGAEAEARAEAAAGAEAAGGVAEAGAEVSANDLPPMKGRLASPKLAIGSGKGGTGKTLFATHLAALLTMQDAGVVHIDCDVEAPVVGCWEKVCSLAEVSDRTGGSDQR
jgi:Mrp family chromosome partitioning ATPase